MYKPRIIPVLLLDGEGLVKGQKFRNHRYLGDPINAVRIFNDKKVDELIFLDINTNDNGINYSLVENIQAYLIDNQTYMEHITINNILIKKYYNWDNASQKLLNIYNGILN